MKTDAQLLKLFQTNPEMLKEFLPLDVKGQYVLRSETLKELERRVDGVFEPEDPEEPVFIIEFQAYWKETIYHLLVAGMALFGLVHPKREVRGIILFFHKYHDPKTKPWYEIACSALPGIQLYYLDKVLEALRERDPDHILLSVFFPLSCEDASTLKKEARGHYQKIQKTPLSEVAKDGMMQVFNSWLVGRFENAEEVAKMIAEIPPIEGSAFARYFEDRGGILGQLKILAGLFEDGVITRDVYSTRATPLKAELAALSDEDENKAHSD